MKNVTILKCYRQFWGMAWLLLFGTVQVCAATARVELPVLTISVPGPGALAFIPFDLIPRIGADRAEGVQVQLVHADGGGSALNQLTKLNVDFATVALPVFMSLRAHGGKVVALAAAANAPLYSLAVRADLKGKVRKMADLQGRVLGLPTSSLSSKSGPEQFLQLVLRAEGMAPDAVRVIPAGLTQESNSALLLSGRVDAILTEGAIVSRLVSEGKVFTLLNFADPAVTRNIPGAGFLHATLGTRAELLQEQPESAAKMVRILQRSLAWIASHTPEQLVEKLGIADDMQRKSLLLALKSSPQLFSRDGRFSTAQLKETEVFFRLANEGDATAQALQLETMIDARWAGRKP
jgi:NitT/TauT family transport system substrate-binding protein